jgi:hypothetical protein
MAGDVHWDALQALAERLDRIEKYLTDLGGQVAGHPYAPLRAGLPPKVAELAQAGKTVEAIQLYRQLTSTSLNQAKEAV